MLVSAINPVLVSMSDFKSCYMSPNPPVIDCFCSRAAVVRGQVVTPGSGMGLIGVRVSTTLPNEGFTMTRDDGWFDLMVNGGGAVMLQFGRSPYPPMR